MRPPGVEWGGTGSARRFEHGAPLLREGQRLAGTRDASFLSYPDVRTIKAVHVAVVTHRYGVGGGMNGIGAACDPVHILLDDTLLRPAASIHPNGRCIRPACRKLFLEEVGE